MQQYFRARMTAAYPGSTYGGRAHLNRALTTLSFGGVTNASSRVALISRRRSSPPPDAGSPSPNFAGVDADCISLADLFRVLLQPIFHLRDFLFLIDDDFLGQGPDGRILAVRQLHLGHIDRALMMRDHAADKIQVGVAAI
jgi:hypothetical protein